MVVYVQAVVGNNKFLVKSKDGHKRYVSDSSSSSYSSVLASVSPYHAHYWVVVFQPITAATGALGSVPILC